METWVTKSFGGDRLILVPTQLPLGANASAPHAMPNIGLDAAAKM